MQININFISHGQITNYIVNTRIKMVFVKYMMHIDMEKAFDRDFVEVIYRSS